MIRSADADRPGRRTLERRRQADLAFLEKLRVATLEELNELALNHCGKNAPAWKKVAIQRAIKRRKP